MAELKIKTDAELQRLLAEFQDKLRDLKFRLSSEQFKNVREIRKVRKAIARIKTLIRQLAEKERLSKNKIK